MRKYLICLSLFSACGAQISENYEFEAQFRALFLKEGSNNLHYAVETANASQVSPQWKAYNMFSDYDFDFDIGFSAIAKESNIKLSTNWERASSHAKNAQRTVSPNMIGPFFEAGPEAATINVASGNAEYNYNAVHFTAGQIIEYNDNLEFIPYIGIEFARIKQCLQIFFATPTPASILICSPTYFQGAGPECGFEFSYSWCQHFSLRGYMGAALLAGNVHNKTQYLTKTALLAQQNAPSPNIQNLCVDKNLITVPHLRERLAIGYHKSFCDDSYGAILEVGYETQWYGNVIQTVDVASEIDNPPPTGIYPRTFQKNISNFSLFGPYIAVTVHF